MAPGDLLPGVEIKADNAVANILADVLIHLTEGCLSSGQGEELSDYEWDHF